MTVNTFLSIRTWRNIQQLSWAKLSTAQTLSLYASTPGLSQPEALDEKRTPAPAQGQKSAFRSGSGSAILSPFTNLKRGIRKSKAAKRKIDNYLHSNNTRQVWQGVQHINSYKSSNLSAKVASLNHFFFEVEPLETATSHPIAHNSHILTVEEQTGKPGTISHTLPLD